MAANSRFAVAIHVSVVLAIRGDELESSEAIAHSVNTNPVVIRRILSALGKAGLVEAQMGKGGGARLKKRAEQITLLDIYRSVEERSFFALSERPEKKQCPISCHMKDLIAPVFQAVDGAVEQTLRKMTLASLLEALPKSARK